MAGTERPLWERLELDYVRRLSPFRVWKRWLSVGCAVAAIGWVATTAARNDATLYSSGPLAAAHAALKDQCHKCHTRSWRAIHRLLSPAATDAAMNGACLACHAGTIGHDAKSKRAWHALEVSRPSTEVPQLACASCHAEHEGAVRLTDVRDARCVTCHADLSARHARPDYANAIHSFAGDHPEFRVLAEATPDPASIKLNHELHMRPDLRGPRGPVQMKCADCHRAGRSPVPWPHGEPDLHEDARLATGNAGTAAAGPHMEPIRYSLHCAQCHELTADPIHRRLNGESVVPHRTPRAIRTFLWGQLTRFIGAHPEALTPPPPDREARRPTLRTGDPRQRDALSLEWVGKQASMLEKKIYRDKKLCLLCHDQQWPDDNDGLPAIVTSGIPIRWLDRASFNHARHRVSECNDCHKRAATSRQTSDVLLPGITTCRKCHAPPSRRRGAVAGGAADHCSTCHAYHRSPQAAPPGSDRLAADHVARATPLDSLRAPHQ